MGSMDMSGRRIVVVGASAGVGRAFARLAIDAGAEVVAVARRRAALEDLVKEAGGGHVLAADLAVADDCARIGAESGQMLGGVDLVLFSAGVGPLERIEKLEQDAWAQTYAVNVIGVNLAIAGLLPHLAPRAIVAAMSTESVGRPHWGLAAYASSKSALEETMRSWRIEHPEFRFSTVPIGATMPTEFGAGFDQELLIEAFQHWSAAGLQTEMMQTDDVASAMLHALGAVLPTPMAGVEQLVLRPAAVQDGTADVFLQAAGENNLLS